MNAMDIIRDSIRYTTMDAKQLLKLSLPTFVILIIFELSVNFLNSGYAGFLLLVYLFLGIILILYNLGLLLNVIRQTVNLEDVLPHIDFKKFLLDGFKYLIVEFVLVIIVSVIVLFICDYIKLHSESALMLLILLVIFAVLTIYLSILNVVASGLLAQTGSIADALSFTHLRQVADRIGKLKIYGTLLLAGIISSLLSNIFLFIQVPVIDIILLTVVGTAILVFNGRVMALLYNQRNVKDNNSPVNQQSTMTANYYPTSSVNKYNRENNQFSSDSFEDYIEKSEQEDLKDTKLVACSKCGHSNPDFIELCLNCGEKL